MRQINSLILVAGLILGGAGFAGGQPDGRIGLRPGMMPEGMDEMQREEARLTKEASPEFYAYLERLKRLSAEISKIVQRLANNEIDKDAARNALLPLVTEEKEIQNDPNFSVEQKIVEAVAATPDYRARMQAATQKMVKRKQAADQKKVKKAGAQP